jgi:hypothetical protein
MFLSILGEKFRTVLGDKETPVKYLRAVNVLDAIFRYR